MALDVEDEIAVTLEPQGGAIGCRDVLVGEEALAGREGERGRGGLTGGRLQRDALCDRSEDVVLVAQVTRGNG